MKKKLFLVLIILLALAGLGIYIVLNYSYSRGVRTGKLVKLSKKGFLITTYEGTLDLGSGDQLTWQFSIHDKDLGNELIVHSGRRVKLTYIEHIFKLFYDTKYNVTDWEFVDSTGSRDANFCRFVNVIKTNPGLVNQVRDHVIAKDPRLLQIIRSCK
ncbi:MAG: 6-phosphogluconate dehydrogenase [Bacteriovoracaceae bacterium]|nr:6-phosphogluconate dehydrogenase [Bacteriovoracaceae bacterium]